MFERFLNNPVGKSPQRTAADGRLDASMIAAVEEQRERLCGHYLFKGQLRQELLTLLVEGWLDGRTLTAEFLAAHLSDAETTKRGPATIRGNLSSLRSKLLEYYGRGQCDPVIIDLPLGESPTATLGAEYRLRIEWNPGRSGPDLDPKNARLISRARLAIDAGTYAGANLALTYLYELDRSTDNPTLWANIAFLFFSIAPMFPAAACGPEGDGSAKRLVERARNLAPGFWESAFAHACFEASHNHQWDRALDLLQHAAEHSRGEAVYSWWCPALLAATGRLPEAISILESAVRGLARRNPAVRADLALLQIMARRYPEAEETLSAASDFVPASDSLFSCMFAVLYEAQDKFDQAVDALSPWIDEAREAMARDTGPDGKKRADAHFLTLGITALLVGRLGRRRDANRIVIKLIEEYQRHEPLMPCLPIALALIGMQEYDEAVGWLTESAFQRHEPYSMWFHIFPPLRHLRRHKGYRDLLVRLNLPLQRDDGAV